MSWFRFDFAVFGAFADVIGAEFFPSSSEDMQVLTEFSAYNNLDSDADSFVDVL